MRAYLGTLNDFYKDVRTNAILNKVEEETHRSYSNVEERAINNSLPALAIALQNASLPLDCEVGIEFVLPLSSNRIDFLICGRDEVDKDHIIIVELKQWDRAWHTDMNDIIQIERYGHREDRVHPSWQSYSYKTMLENFNEYIQKNNIDVNPIAFLHNYEVTSKEELFNKVYAEGIANARPFIKTDYVEIAKYIESKIKKKSKDKFLFEVMDGKIRPSQMLVESLGQMLNGNKCYELIDDQRIVYSNLRHELFKLAHSDQKHVFIVNGGMGTGKSLIAIQLLATLTKHGLSTFYVAKSSYLRESYFKKLTNNIPSYHYLRTLFKGSGEFIDTPNNTYHCLIVDESQRLTQKTKRSFMYYGDNQIKEIIHSARNIVFFIDEKQQIDLKDFGTVENIIKFAKEENAIVHYDPVRFTLKSQFRCSDGEEYIAWLDSLLYNEPFVRSDIKCNYDVKVFDDLIDLKKAIVNKNKIGTSRILSGDVFPWISRGNKNSFPDINVGEFHAYWNKRNSFAVDPNSIDEVGCIHTCQGMEFYYAGVIIGDDLYYKDGEVKTNYAKHPTVLMNLKGLIKRILKKMTKNLLIN